ncbi:kinase-like protein, partial [Marasmius fiardii PR-910]
LAEHSDHATRLQTSIVHAMLRLSECSSLYPQPIVVENVKKLGDRPIGISNFGYVWKGRVGKQTNFMREAIVWQQLKHPNLLPFMGMYFLDDAQKQLCLISPWMEHGNLLDFLNKSPREGIDHYSLVYDITSGLSYLHSKETVHGDLKSVIIHSPSVTKSL